MCVVVLFMYDSVVSMHAQILFCCGCTAMAEAEKDRRLRHRLAGYMYVLSSDDYLYMLCCDEPLLMPCSPDPADETVSKRNWEHHMGRWKADLRSLRAALSELDSALQSHGF